MSLSEMDETGDVAEIIEMLHEGLSELPQIDVTSTRTQGRLFDVFVHHVTPFDQLNDLQQIIDAYYPQSVTGSIRDYISQYRFELKRRIEDSRNPLFVTDASGLTESQRKEASLLPATYFENGIPSAMDEGAKPPVPLGFLEFDNFHVLLRQMEGMHPDDQIRIHGYTHGFCPRHMAIQLLAAKLHGRFYPPATEELLASEAADSIECLDSLAEFEQSFESSNIRTGVQFDAFNQRVHSTAADTFERQMHEPEQTLILPQIEEG